MTHSNITIFHRACQRLYDARATPALNYAVAYALCGFGLTDPEAIRVQCFYILNNMQHWRGAVAKECREDFKRISQEGSWK